MLANLSCGHKIIMTVFYTLPHNSDEVLWYHVGCTCVRKSVVRVSVLLFPDNNLSECQWIFTKLSVCIDIVDVWFGIANMQFLTIWTDSSAHDMSVFSFPDDNMFTSFSPNLVCALILWRSGFRLPMGKFH